MTGSLGYSGKKKAHNINFWSGCPWDNPGFVLGTNSGFLLILHSGSPICPRDKRSLRLGQAGVEER